MRTCVLFLSLLAFVTATHYEAQLASTLDDKSARGIFYVSVDDAATIYINGKKFYSAGIGESRSPETELKTGDRLVVQLRDDGGGRHFVMLFASSDGQSVVSFRGNDFKIIPDLDVTDFTPAQYEKWKTFAKQEKFKYPLPIKSYSESFWGDLNNCILACTVKPRVFSQRPQ